VRSDVDAAQRSEVAALLKRCASADRHPALPEPQRMAVAQSDLGTEQTRVLLAYDDADLVGLALLTPVADGSTSLHVVVDPARRTGADDVAFTLTGRALDEVAAPGQVRLWVMRATEADDVEAARHHFTPERDLLQMRVPLPLPPAIVSAARPVTTRPFEPGRDEAGWLDINNRAFAGHPEQGAWTLEQLHERLSAAWVDLEGFLMADDPDGDGLIGSCWTKVVRPADPVLGEIYVISVDPDRAGQGWGRALTVAGLEWMAAREVTVGMLYTDVSNTAAVALYHSVGFTIDHVDRAYGRAGAEPGLI